MIRNLCFFIPRGSQWQVMMKKNYKSIYLQVHKRKLQSVSVNRVLPPTSEESYDAQNNPNGVVNLGTGTNFLMQSEVGARITHLRTNQLSLIESENSQDRENETCQAVAAFMTKFFKSSFIVQPHQLKLLNNVTSCIDLLGTYLGYSRLFKGCTQYSALEVVPVFLKHDSDKDEYFCLTVSALEEAITEQVAQGKCVRGIIITNPNNPTGAVYSSQLILEIMELCHKYDLHVIMSEVYCLSVFDEKCKFTSVLELGSKIPDPHKTHVLWGLTKDACLTEFHCAVLYSTDTELMSKIQPNTLFSSVSIMHQHLLTTYINDHEWIEKVFLVKNHERMKRAYLRSKLKLESLDIEVYPSVAGFFLFCNFRRILNPATEKNCIEMSILLNRNRVYVVPYWEMRTFEPGWFRIVFTAEDHIFDAGFERIRGAVEEWKKSQNVL